MELVPYAKGGEYRKWYGNNEYVVDWENEARIYSYESMININLLRKIIGIKKALHGT